MVNIIIYTTADKLLHKQGKLPDDEDWSESGFYYWRLNKTPKRISHSGRIYFAVKGYIRGYFLIRDVDDSDGCDIEFDSESWKDIEPIKTKSFQGFKYSDKVPELNSERKPKAK